jgi:hypothetical protein
VAALVPPAVCAAANVIVPPVATVLEPPPPVAGADRAKIVGEARFGPDCATTAGPADGAAPLTAAVTTGAEVLLALEVPPDVAAGRPLTAANNVFGVTRAARFGPVEIETCFMGVDAIGA